MHSKRRQLCNTSALIMLKVKDTQERAHFWLLNHIYPSLQTEREYSYKFTS